MDSQEAIVKSIIEIVNDEVDKQDWGYEGNRGIALIIEIAIEKKFSPDGGPK